MPTEGDHFFATNPVSLDCPETEGTPCPPIIDTSTTLLVDFLNGAPAVGDLAVATAVGGRWVAERGGSKPTKICALYTCGPNALFPIVGATINLISGGTTVATCTTDSFGCCTFTQKGTFTVQLIVAGQVCSTGASTRTLTGTNITLFASTDCTPGLICCGNLLIPTAGLTLTDALGGLALTYDGPDFADQLTWTAYRQVAVASPCWRFDPSDPFGCIGQPLDSGSVAICYTLTCRPTATTDHFRLTRNWITYTNVIFGPPPPALRYVEDSSIASGLLSCATLCGATFVGAVGQADPTSTTPLVVSFPMVEPDPLTAANYMPDPVGGNVVVSSL
jgi:hypothetical protein